MSHPRPDITRVMVRALLVDVYKPGGKDYEIFILTLMA